MKATTEIKKVEKLQIVDEKVIILTMSEKEARRLTSFIGSFSIIEFKNTLREHKDSIILLPDDNISDMDYKDWDTFYYALNDAINEEVEN